MSDPNASNRATISGVGVLGIALGLLLLGGLIGVLVGLRGKEIDGAAELERRLGVRALPFELVVTRAHESALGETVVVLGGLASEPAPPLADSGPKAAPDSAPRAASDRIDWKAIDLGAQGAAPIEATFLFFTGTSHEKVHAIFQSMPFRDVSKLEDEGGMVVVETGKLDWRGFDAIWTHQRHYARPGTFTDAIRVDVSLPNAPALLTLRWPRGKRASKPVLDVVLAALSKSRS